MDDAPAVPPPASAATAVVASAITATSLRRRDRSGRLICSPIRRRAEQIMRAVDGAGYADQAGSVWSEVILVTARSSGESVVGRAVPCQSAGISPGCFSTTQ